MPDQCKHGVYVDWGDFGPDNVAGDPCHACGIVGTYYCDRCWNYAFLTLAEAKSCDCAEGGQ